MQRVGAVATVWLTLMTLGVVQAAETPPVTPSAAYVDAEIRALEDKDRKAMLRGDVEALSRIWATNLLVTPPSNKIRTGAEVLGMVKQGGLKYSSLERRIERVSLQNAVVIVMGSETAVRGNGPDTGKKVERRFTDVFMHEQAEWRLIARHVNNVPAGNKEE